MSQQPSPQSAERLARLRPALISLAETLIAPAHRTHVDASDLVQQTLMEAHCSRELLDNLSSEALFAWLRSALRNNVVDAIRSMRAARHDIRRSMREADLDDSFARLERLLVVEETTPSQLLQRNEEIFQMLSALQLLPDSQRLAIIYKHLRGLSLRETAAQLDISESAVAGLLHRGRRSLLERMSQNS